MYHLCMLRCIFIELICIWNNGLRLNDINSADIEARASNEEPGPQSCAMGLELPLRGTEVGPALSPCRRSAAPSLRASFHASFPSSHAHHARTPLHRILPTPWVYSAASLPVPGVACLLEGL